MAPDKIKLSTTFLLTACKSTRLVKSNNETNGPPSSLAKTICSSALIPTFLIAFKPNDIVLSSTGWKCISETFISGGEIVISIFLHSLIKITTLSILFISLVKLADINSAGW